MVSLSTCRIPFIPIHNPAHEFQIISDTEIAGYKGSGGWAVERSTLGFMPNLTSRFNVFFTTTGKIVPDVKSAKSKKLLAVLTFDTKDDKEVLAKVGISHVGYEGAKNNLEL
jgi:putative alpha-1,2-mannosidase